MHMVYENLQRNQLKKTNATRLQNIKNISHKNIWNSGMAQVHVKALPIPLLKVISGGKSDKDIIILKLRRDPTSRTSDLYEFKIYLFDNEKTE